MADINIQAIEKIRKLNRRITLISDKTAQEMYKILSRINNLEIAVDELRSGERSRFSRRRNPRGVVARGRGGRRTRGKLRAKSRGKSRKKRCKSRRKSKGRKRGRKKKKKTKRRR
tara:strand:- start:10 stop:354 length:345 start_codon:yes stop_codon:yes gene_type:complete